MPRKKLLLLLFLIWSGSAAVVAADYATIRSMIPDQLLLADSLSQVFYSNAKAIENDEFMARGAYLLGLTNYYKGNLYLSAKYYREALDRAYVDANKDFAESCWNNLGIVCELQNDLPAAFAAYQNSLALAKARQDGKGVAETQINIGLLELKRQNNKEGIAILEEALVFFEQTNDTLYVALCLQNIGVAFKTGGDFDRAEEYFQMALERFTATDNAYGIAEGLINVGYVRGRQGDVAGARDILEEGRQLSQQNGFRYQEAVAMINLAELDMETGNLEEARRKYLFAVEVMEELNIYDQWEAAYQGLLRSAVMTGDIRLFDTSLAEFQYAMNKRISSETTARYNEFKAMYELEDKLRQIETQQQEIRDKRRQITFLGIFLLLAVGVAGGIGFLLIRTRFLMQELFRKNEVILEQRLAAPESPSTDTTGVDDKLWQLFRDIDTAMDRQHLYRDSKLTLSSLSKQFASNDTYVSRAINLHANVNFNTYINNYRVLAAQKMMTVKGKSPNIEEIIEQCGFSSRKSFFRIFKQQTGLTPSQYITQARFDRPAGVFSDIPDGE